MRLLSPLPNLDDSGFILDELAHRLPAQPPSFREFSDSVVLLGEATGVEGAGGIDNRPEMKHTLYWLAVECCTHNCLFSERRPAMWNADAQANVEILSRIRFSVKLTPISLTIAMSRDLTELEIQLMLTVLVEGYCDD